MTTKQAAITAAHRSNVRASFDAVGLPAKDFDKVPQQWQDYLCRAWAFYVDHGFDFGSAAIRVLNDIEKAAG